MTKFEETFVRSGRYDRVETLVTPEGEVDIYRAPEVLDADIRVCLTADEGGRLSFSSIHVTTSAGEPALVLNDDDGQALGSEPLQLLAWEMIDCLPAADDYIGGRNCAVDEQGQLVAPGEVVQVPKLDYYFMGTEFSMQPS